MIRRLVLWLLKTRWVSHDDEGTQQSRCQRKVLAEGEYGLSVLGLINGWQPFGYGLVVQTPDAERGLSITPIRDGWGIYVRKRWW